MQPLDLIGAAPWRQTVFTTYSLSLSFFEAVVLDRLVRGGGRNALILADPVGIRAGLSEEGARRAGREYEVEPVANTTGVFHPKLTLLFAESDAHLLVGSGNLTFGGWGMNLETVDHLHPTFAADAFDDAADLFESLSIADNIRTGLGERFEPLAEQIRLVAKNFVRGGNFRLLHSMSGSIAGQLKELADDLGGAYRVTIVSPYFDRSGIGVVRLAELLNCEDVRLHHHPKGAVRGTLGTNWPSGERATPVTVGEPFGKDDRQLHAKCIEILCRRGRLLMSGSANATNAALFAGNVEASLVRIQRDSLARWSMHPAAAPPDHPEIKPDGDEDVISKVGILRGVLEEDRVIGQVIVPRMHGNAILSVLTADGSLNLGIVCIDSSGKFEASAPNLSMQSWHGGRMVLRVEQDQIVAEGFVSIAAAAKIIQRAGALAPRIFSMLSGTETPQDVAAILTWFKEDLDRITPVMVHGRHEHGQESREPTWVPIEALRTASDLKQNSDSGPSVESDLSWRRALRQLHSAFSDKRGPWQSATDEDEEREYEHHRQSENERLKKTSGVDAREQVMKALDGLLDKMLDEGHAGAHALSAFALAQYLADRVRPAPTVVQGWLSRILRDFNRHSVPIDTAVATAGALAIATDGRARASKRVRAFLLRAGIDPLNFCPDAEAVPGFFEVLQPSWETGMLMESVRSARTSGEEVRAYLEAANNGRHCPPLPSLESNRHWPQLVAALTDEKKRSRLMVIQKIEKACPKCHIVLPIDSQQELRMSGVTSHCRIILCTEI